MAFSCTAQYKILPFDYLTSSLMLDGFSTEEKFVLYSVTGGVPEYLSRIDKNLSVYENVRDLFFNPSGRLFEEPGNLLKQELKMPQTYNAIITAIAEGKSKLNEIAAQAGIETSQCSQMLNTLIKLGLCNKVVPITEKQTAEKHFTHWKIKCLFSGIASSCPISAGLLPGWERWCAKKFLKASSQAMLDMPLNSAPFNTCGCS